MIWMHAAHRSRPRLSRDCPNTGFRVCPRSRRLAFYGVQRGEVLDDCHSVVTTGGVPGPVRG